MNQNEIEIKIWQLVVTTARRQCVYNQLLPCVFDSLAWTQSLRAEKLIAVVTWQSVVVATLENEIIQHIGNTFEQTTYLCECIKYWQFCWSQNPWFHLPIPVQDTIWMNSRIDLLLPLFGIHRDIFHNAQTNILWQTKLAIPLCTIN